MHLINKDKGQLFIISAPSGGGKTSLVTRLIQDLPYIEVSISHTTRPKRPGEKDGVHYFFIHEACFHQMVEKHEFVEHARVFDYYYGTSYAEINDRLNHGIDVVLDIDWQGALQIKRLYQDAVGVFIIPPSMEILQRRLQNRQQDDENVIQHRMQQAQREMGHYRDFDFLIVNDEFEIALDELKSIVSAQRLSLRRQALKQQKLLSFLLTTQ